MNKISVVISAHNEEKNLKECLESVQMFDEIIVVDNSSTDKTQEIAEKYTKKVYEQKNDPLKIDLQKNFGFSKATGDWILSLDADERVSSELAWEIKERVGSAGNIQGFWIPRENIIFGKVITSEMWSPDYQLRLFRKGKGKYENSVHKALSVEGPTEKLTNSLVHNNYTNVSQYLEKLTNYTAIEAENLTAQGYKFNWLDSIRFPLNDLLKTFFLQKGYRDGLHGLVLSILQAFYMEIVFVRLWEKRGYEEVKNDNFLDEVVDELKRSVGDARYWIRSATLERTKNPLKKAGLKILRKVKK